MNNDYDGDYKSKEEFYDSVERHSEIVFEWKDKSYEICSMDGKRWWFFNVTDDTEVIVNTIEVSVLNLNGEDYICLTDMMKAKDGEFFVTDWLRNRNTLEYIGIWEKIYNPNFNYGEFAIIRNQAGLNRFKISVKDFVQRTNAISLQSKAGRYGGTYAHKDIAFEFAMWISPEFKIYMVKEFQRLKAEEQAQLGWSAKRELSKINYRIHTDAIKHNLIPTEITPAQASLIYANEVDE